MTDDPRSAQQSGHRPSDPRPSAVQQVNPKYLFFVAAVTVLVALAATVVYVFFEQEREPVTYVVVVVLLFFALSTASSLLFANAAALKGTVMGVTVSIVGPAALWFAGMLMFFYMLPPEELFPAQRSEDLDSIADVLSVAADLERRHGWSTYEDWKAHQTTVRELFDDEESHTLGSLLAIMFETKDVSKVIKPHVTTMFVYFKQGVVKLQRIQGSREGAKAHIRFQSTPTKEGASAKSALFIGDRRRGRLVLENAITDITSRGRRGIEEISSDPVDCFILTLYDDPVIEDYLVVNMRRFSNYDGGVVDLAAVSLDPAFPIADASLWYMKPALSSLRRPPPLVFLDARGNETDSKRIHSQLQPWLDTLDDSLQSGRIGDESLQQLLERVMGKFRSVAEQMGETGFRNLADIPWLLDQAEVKAYQLPQAEFATLMLLRRG